MEAATVDVSPSATPTTDPPLTPPSQRKGPVKTDSVVISEELRVARDKARLALDAAGGDRDLAKEFLQSEM